MDAFFIRLLIAALVIWFTQVILGELKLQEPANRVIFWIVVVVAVLYALFGLTYLPL